MASVRPPTAAAALESHQRLADELRGKIDDGLVEAGPAPETRSVDDLRPYVTHRDWLLHLIHSYKYQTAVIVMVILDCICVIAELLIDLEIASSSGGTVAKEVLHSISIAILSCFLVEIVVKLYAYRVGYFRMPWEMFDAVVVIVSFALDVAFRSTVGPINGAGLIIVLRLWRVTRILSGMVMSVRRHSEHKLELEQRARHRLQRDLDESRDYCRRLEQRLQQHGLALPEPRPDGADPDGAPGGDAGDATV
ncbi:voltage-gated hydrogen channel 1-like [Pollicipes pollicipes]|uniref:voltage-gated hydrogen channel 1-like n=1 Tax=Pollicipes pollicipes TaxID=41117 RepID=UPI0018859E4E|nr:voltage-gated hydrogen channel 1-like [Pollicipes pollicipes]XP_037093083.1 voltage-gated hydrogen channel 1-like [Pollicipes pollicipes]